MIGVSYTGSSGPFKSYSSVSVNKFISSTSSCCSSGMSVFFKSCGLIFFIVVSSSCEMCTGGSEYCSLSAASINNVCGVVNLFLDVLVFFRLWLRIPFLPRPICCYMTVASL